MFISISQGIPHIAAILLNAVLIHAILGDRTPMLSNNIWYHLHEFVLFIHPLKGHLLC